GTALEQSNTVTIQFVLHKNGELTGPRAQTPTHFIFMGIDVNHELAMQLALREALDFLRVEKGLSPADAMSFASLAVDLNIAEAVDFTNLVMARVPKLFFRKNPDFWHRALLRVRTEAQRQGLQPWRRQHAGEEDDYRRGPSFRPSSPRYQAAVDRRSGRALVAGAPARAAAPACARGSTTGAGGGADAQSEGAADVGW